MDIDSFIIKIKTDDVYKDIVIDVGKRFDISNEQVKRPAANIDLFKVNNRNPRKRCEIC